MIRSRGRILFIGGSVNQVSQLHAVSRHLPEYASYFTPFFGDELVELARRLGLIEVTIGGNKRRGFCIDYLESHKLPIDMHGRTLRYDLIVSCTDLVVQRITRNVPFVVVQEGILDPETIWSRLGRRFQWIPRWASGTTLTGLSGAYDKFCVASEGYRDLFVAAGADPSRIVVTGMPNFDDCKAYANNRFPLHDFVLVCTSDARETLKRDNRKAFIASARRIAAGRQLVFKLHPNENVERASREIRLHAPEALVYYEGRAEEMIANCATLITQWSSTAFVGLALGKEVYSEFSRDELHRLLPIQNGGTSAEKIAAECRAVLERSASRLPLRALQASERSVSSSTVRVGGVA